MVKYNGVKTKNKSSMREHINEKFVSTISGITWIVLNNPHKDELELLKKHYKFHRLDIEDCLSKAQRPKIDEYPTYLFTTLNIPIWDAKKDVITKSQIYFFLGKDFVVTVHDHDKSILEIVKKFKKNRKILGEYMDTSSAYLLYMIIDDLFESTLPMLEILDQDLYSLEQELFDNKLNSDKLKDILSLKKDLINFRRIIMPERSIIAMLEPKSKRYDGTGLEVYYDDIVDKVEKIWNNLENLYELLVSLYETNESITSHNTNNVIKMLTVFSVLIMPMTVITGFYGMNVKGLPFSEHPLSTLFILMGLVSLALLMILYFKMKKWI